MALRNDPLIPANIGKVGMGAAMVFVPVHHVQGPLSVGRGGCYSLSMQSGTMAISLGANSELFQFRYVTATSRQCLSHGVNFAAGANVAAGATTTSYFRMAIARGWTTAGSSGTRAVLTPDTQKMRTKHNFSEVNDAGIATTAALTAGTKTIDTNDISTYVCDFSTALISVGATLPLVPRFNLFGEFVGGLAMPIVLENQEGFVIRNGPAFPTGMTWTFGVDVLWSEVDRF